MHNVSLNVSPIKYKDNYYFFLMPSGINESGAYDHYPVTVTKDFDKSYDLEIGNSNTRFVRLVGDKLIIA